MDCKTAQHEENPPSLLALIRADGGDMGTTLIRLAHLAAARHRFEIAAAAAEPYRATGTEHPDRIDRLPSREPLR